MQSATEPSNIEYGVLTARDTADMTRVLAQVFCRKDPLAVAAGLDVSDFEKFVHLLCPKAVEEGLTIVAREKTTKELIGALLTEDGASPPPLGLDQLSRKFDPIFHILGELEEEHRGGAAPRLGESAHLFLLGVASSAERRGVAQRLVAACVRNAATRGYRRAVTEATSKVSQHVFRKLGFADRVRRQYEHHRFEGRAVFASIAEHGGPILMDRSLAL